MDSMSKEVRICMICGDKFVPPDTMSDHSTCYECEKANGYADDGDD